MKQQQTWEEWGMWSDEKLPSLPTSTVTAAPQRMSPLRCSAAEHAPGPKPEDS